MAEGALLSHLPGPWSFKGPSLPWGSGLWEDQSYDEDRVGWSSEQPVAETGGVGCLQGTKVGASTGGPL